MGKYTKSRDGEEHQATHKVQVYCAAPGCGRHGTVSYSHGQDEFPKWYCLTHWRSPDAPPEPPSEPHVTSYERERAALESELRAACDAAVGERAPGYVKAAWWRERFSAYARDLAGRQKAGLAGHSAARPRDGGPAQRDGEGVRTHPVDSGGEADDCPF